MSDFNKYGFIAGNLNGIFTFDSNFNKIKQVIWEKET